MSGLFGYVFIVLYVEVRDIGRDMLGGVHRRKTARD